jgi:hypothetical protein
MKNLSVKGTIDGHTLVYYSVEPVIAKSIEVNPFEVTTVISGYVKGEQIFPKHQVKLDNALLMKNIQHKGGAGPCG